MTTNKRNKERARLEKLQQKKERLERRRSEKKDRPDAVPGEDPDLAGMTLGPQPLPEAFNTGNDREN